MSEDRSPTHSPSPTLRSRHAISVIWKLSGPRNKLQALKLMGALDSVSALCEPMTPRLSLHPTSTY